MKAVRIHEPVGVDGLVYEDAPDAEPAVGDAVFGLIDGYRDGAAAEYIAIEARDVAPKPRTLDHVEAAALPQAGLTSWQGLFVHGGLKQGQTVAIQGAGG